MPGERWLTILMNRINPALFSAAFSGWVRESWPDLGATGRTSSPSMAKPRAGATAAARAPGHSISYRPSPPPAAWCPGRRPCRIRRTNSRRSRCFSKRLGAEDGLRGALVSIDAIATNATVAEAITAQRADCLLAVKANQPTPRAELEAGFAASPPGAPETWVDLDRATAASSSAGSTCRARSAG